MQHIITLVLAELTISKLSSLGNNNMTNFPGLLRLQLLLLWSAQSCFYKIYCPDLKLHRRVSQIMWHLPTLHQK